MAASVTDIQNAIKTTIDAAKAVNGAFALPMSVDISDSQATTPPKPSDFIQVQIAYIGAAELARSSVNVLEQALVGVNLSLRNANGSQHRFDACHQVAQQLRDLLINFTTNGARVEQILAPNPFDQQSALQGIFDHKLTLDLDVLRPIATAAPPTITDTDDATPVMSKTREAVWNAIDNWPAFSDSATWVRKFKTAADLEELSLHDPAVGELPAIAVTWGPTDPKWWVNTMQQWSQQLFVTFYLPAGWRDVAEWRLIQLMQAFYKCAPEDHPGVSYIRGATGRLPTKSPISLELVAIGRAQKLHVWQGQIALTLPINFDPNQ
jgi:hypothetical protein